MLINPFHANSSLLYPLKTSKTKSFSVFRGVSKCKNDLKLVSLGLIFTWNCYMHVAIQMIQLIKGMPQIRYSGILDSKIGENIQLVPDKMKYIAN